MLHHSQKTTLSIIPLLETSFTARLGSTVAGACGEVTSVDEALALAHGEHEPASTSELALASMLQRAAAARERALEAA